jgi:hypothetical protein
MTEAGWLSCNDADRMLRFLCGQEEPAAGSWLVRLGLRSRSASSRQHRASDRKLRLFACACAQRAADLFLDERSLRALEAGEAYADGKIGEAEARAASAAAWQALDDLLKVPATDRDPTGLVPYSSRRKGLYWRLAAWAATEAPFGAPEKVVQGVVRAALHFAEEGYDARLMAAAVGAAAREALLRDIFGNPFREPVLAPACLAANSGTARKLADALYAEAAFERLPILADALEEAGCTDGEILAHCRENGNHVRGCWVLDLVRGVA